MRQNAYDLVLLDEQMPGGSGLEVLEIMRREDPHVRVVMVTKSARRSDHDGCDRTAGRRLSGEADESPPGSFSRHPHPGGVVDPPATCGAGFRGPLRAALQKREEARTSEDFAELYIELTGWHVSLEEAGERGLLDTVQSLMTDLRSDFGRWIGLEYPRWLKGEGDPPCLSVDVVQEHLLRSLGPPPSSWSCWTACAWTNGA